ncbi:MAG TPA: ABC transporter substrate-binding protein [Chloroflexota bacterium]|jgi:peptide/nickel transport system substrate-binding protein
MEAQPARISRRAYLRRSVAVVSGLVGAGLLQACTAPAPPASPTSPPAAAPTTAPAAAAAKPTTAPAAAPTTAPAAVKPAASGGKRGGQLRLALNQEPTAGFDPQFSSPMVSQHHFEQVYEQLLVTQPDGSVLPGLAESFEQTDPRTYVFKLRKGVKWHNGREFNAEDVKYSFERQISTGSINQSIYAPVLDKVEIADASTVRFTTKEPFAPFISYIAGPREGNIVPQEVVTEKGDLKATMIGTGPFKFVEYTPGNEAKFVRNPDYWNKDQPLLDELIIKYIPDDTSRLAALRNNSVDFAYFGSAIFVKPHLTDPAIQWAQGKALNTRHFVLNNSIPPLNDVRVRQAISLSINRQEIVDTNLLGLGAVSTHIPPADEFWTLPNPQNEAKYKNDIEQAKKLLADAGQSNLKLQTKIGPDASYTADSELVQSQLKRAGIELEIVKKEQAAWIDDFLKVNHDSVLMGYSSYVDPDGYFYQSMYSTSSSTRTGIKSEKLDALLNKGRTTTERNQRQQVYYDVQKLVVEEAMELILYAQIASFEAMQPFVKGYVPLGKTFGRGPQLRGVWIDK